MASDNQKLIQRVKREFTLALRQAFIRTRQRRGELKREHAELELLIDDFVAEGHDLRKASHRELLYRILARKIEESEPADRDRSHLTF